MAALCLPATERFFQQQVLVAIRLWCWSLTEMTSFFFCLGDEKNLQEKSLHTNFQLDGEVTL